MTKNFHDPEVYRCGYCSEYYIYIHHCQITGLTNYAPDYMDVIENYKRLEQQKRVDLHDQPL